MKKVFRLENLCCANCAAKIERSIEKLEGVTRTNLNFISTKLVIEGEDSKMPEILVQAEAIIHKIEPDVVVRPQ